LKDSGIYLVQYSSIIGKKTSGYIARESERKNKEINLGCKETGKYEGEAANTGKIKMK